MDSTNNGCSLRPNKERNKKSNRLLKWTQVPAHLKFNPYIHEGYRPLAPLTGCIKSLSYFHNETINILTHGLLHLFIHICVCVCVCVCEGLSFLLSRQMTRLKAVEFQIWFETKKNVTKKNMCVCVPLIT